MKVNVYPADMWGCGHYRMIWPGRALAEQGHDVMVIIPGEDSYIGGMVTNGRITALDVRSIEDVDVLVFQRPTNIMALDLIRLARGRGKAVVVDMDDDLTCIHPSNIAFRMLHPKWSPANNWQIAIEGCRAANLVTVSTPPLLDRYSRYNNARILRNCIPARFLDLDHSLDVEPHWGWGGALQSHPDDLPILGVAASVLDKEGYPFRIIGSPEGTGRALGLAKDPEGPGAVPFEDWMQHVTQLQVGAAPLADTKFNRSKSWLKPLEYAAAGVPFVASDTPEYRALVDLGCGFIANKGRAWTSLVRKLLVDEAFRLEQSLACRAVASEFTIEEHAWRWLETWEGALRISQGLPAVAS